MKNKFNVVVSARGALAGAQVKQLKKAGAAYLEARVDLFSRRDPAGARRIIQTLKGLPLILTIRSKKEGGAWRGTEAMRLLMFQSLIPMAAAVDIELSSTALLKEAVKAARKNRKKIIISYHNFKKTPSAAQLETIFKKAKAAGAGTVKIATMPQSPADVQRLADFTIKHAKDNVATIAMGAKGTISRILFPMLGSVLTYASLGAPTAPGQLNYKTTLKLLGQ